MDDDPIVAGLISGRLVPQPGERFTRTIYDVDMLTRPMLGVTSEIPLLVPEKYSVLDEYPGMFFIDYEKVSSEGLLTQFNERYMGFKDNDLPEPKCVDDVALQSTVLTIISYNAADPTAYASNQYPVQVRCPTTAWTWFETTKPADVPRHKDVRSALSPFSNIASGLFDTGMFAITDKSSPKVKAFYDNFKAAIKTELANLTDSIETQWSGYLVEDLIPARLWRCTCTAIRQPSPVANATIQVPYDLTILD